ncbi:MAG: tetratricopeptide repeat protein [Selenomonadaceae bacterium]|nr:tetratricopeptide repeat protein [Selenomonadaceae bacterium]
MDASYSEELNMLQDAARNGDPVAAYNLGVICEDEGSIADAQHWYRKAAEADDPDAATNLANLLIKEAERIMDEAHRWLTKAAGAGQLQAQYTLATMNRNGQGTPISIPAAVKWYTEAARQGMADAQLELAKIYYNGDNGAVDYSAARHWLEKAAIQGSAEAQFGLGMLFYEGKACVVDLDKAIDWFVMASRSGYSPADVTLGRIYEAKENGLHYNPEAAAAHYEKAAGNGDIIAMISLADLYGNKELSVADPDKSLYWYHKAVMNSSAAVGTETIMSEAPEKIE